MKKTRMKRDLLVHAIEGIDKEEIPQVQYGAIFLFCFTLQHLESCLYTITSKHIPEDSV